jgi:hypothetical protein
MYVLQLITVFNYTLGMILYVANMHCICLTELCVTITSVYSNIIMLNILVIISVVVFDFFMLFTDVSGGRSVGIVRSRTKGHGVCLFVCFCSLMFLFECDLLLLILWYSDLLCC